MHITKDNFQFIPLIKLDKLQNDKILYKRYNLTIEEIAVIEESIKPMD